MNQKMCTENSKQQEEIIVDPDAQNIGKSIGVIIISGSCCNPGMASLDDLAKAVVEQAIAKAKVNAVVKTITATSAYSGGIPRDIVVKILARGSELGMNMFPAVMVDGEVVSHGVPNVDEMVAFLSKRNEKIHVGGV